MSLSPLLGEERVEELSQGRIHYRACGLGQPVVFVHGLLVGGDLWRKVVPGVAEAGYRCIVPDLPLGAHSTPMRPEADLSVPGMARLIADFLEARNLENVTLVANDTGGALAQVVVAEYPERVGRLVLTSCDAYDNFLPQMFQPLEVLAHIPPLLTLLLQGLRLRSVRRLPFALGWLSKDGVDREIEDGYVKNFLGDAGVRRDCYKVLRGISTKHTMAAAQRFSEFDKPVLVAWAAEDRFFPPAHGRRLARAFPQGRLELIGNSYTFISEDNPERLTELLIDFLAE